MFLRDKSTEIFNPLPLCETSSSEKRKKGTLPVCKYEREAILLEKGQSTSHYPPASLGRNDFHRMPCIQCSIWRKDENAITLYLLRNVSIFDM